MNSPWDKKANSTRSDEDSVKDLKHLAVDINRSWGDLLEEAVKDLVEKHERAPKG